MLQRGDDLFERTLAVRAIEERPVSALRAIRGVIDVARYLCFDHLGGDRGNDVFHRGMKEAIRSKRPTLINAVIDEGGGTESGRITSLNPSAKKKV